MKKTYKHIIFDADHTLIDFDEDERRAFRMAFPADTDGETIEDMWRYSYHNWAALGLNDVHADHIQEKYHELYRTHVKCLFDYAEAQYHLSNRAGAEAEFERGLSQAAHFIAGARETVQALSARYAVSVATNGLTSVQTARLSLLKPYLKEIFISEEMGCIKPNGLFFQTVFKKLHTTAEECLMVGDSLSSDIAGANAVNMDAVWFNRYSRPHPDGYPTVADICSLDELILLLR